MSVDLQKLSILEKCKKYFSKSNTSELLELQEAFYSGSDDFYAIYEKFPDEKKLLEELCEKLKGKSVEKTLKRMLESKTDNRFTELKGMFSLGTHVSIELEKGNKKYGALIPYIYEKISNLVYGE